jgi:hypothetical protein
MIREDFINLRRRDASDLILSCSFVEQGINYSDLPLVQRSLDGQVTGQKTLFEWQK